MYKILGYYREIPKELRSKLFDVLWVDGSVFGPYAPFEWELADACGLPGVMYFVFMLRETINSSSSMILITALTVLGILNVGLVLQVQVCLALIEIVTVVLMV